MSRRNARRQISVGRPSRGLIVALSVLLLAGLIVIVAPSDTAFAGVDEDAAADVIFANASGQRNRVCLGNGSGGFVCSDIGSDTGVTGDVALGDVNGDGNLDAVFANFDGQRNKVCLGNGSGVFTCSDVSTDSNDTGGVALGDVNGDGNLDAVFANILFQRNRVCLGDGTGGFVCSDVNTDSNDTWRVALGDVDKDGNLDAVFANPDDSERNRVCLGDGTGGFVCSDVNTDSDRTQDVALGDVDGDGNLDAVFANWDLDTERLNQVCLGNGSGGFVCGDVSADSKQAGDVELADVNGDNNLDAVFAKPVGQRNRVCLGDGSGGFTCSDVSTDSNNSWGVALGDVDRDGHPDAVFANASGQRNRVCLGNGSGGFTCSDVSADTPMSNEVALAPAKRFADTNGNIFENAIEWLADEGITQGCNPPANTMFCPDDFVTRGEMAVFLVRALDYTDNGGGNLFVDDDGLFYENSADRLKTAKVTLGCNPPTNNKYCGEDHVTRGQMAAFLVRAMGYVDNGGGDLFVDDDGHIFENAIDKLGTAGVTLGCNPPTNDRFCPDDKVTRGQMAAFLKRALG